MATTLISEAFAKNIRSPINVCFTSRSSAGAWQIRGVQMAATRTNWIAINKPSNAELEGADVICIIKKPDERVVARAKKLNKPIVFDILDSWAQPEEGMTCTDLHKARQLFSRMWSAIDADGYIFPTKSMRDDLGTLVEKSLTIYHHFKPNIPVNPLREKVLTIGYEGNDYLGEWKPFIEKVAASRGVKFVINPDSYTDVDIVVMARGGVHGNFLSHRYKSNVKLANAYGSGTPALVHYKELSAQETDNGDVLFFTDVPGSFERQLDKLLLDFELRRYVHERFMAASSRFHINDVANQFENFFISVLHNARGGHV